MNLINNCKKTLDSWYELYSWKILMLIEDEDISSLNDDLNTPELISKIHDLAKKTNKGDLQFKKED